MFVVDIERKIELVKRKPLEEVVTEEDLRSSFENYKHPKHYIGLEISGKVHLGSTKMRGAGGDRWTFTASGSVTIMSARLSDYAQGGQILIGEETARRIEKFFPMTHLGKVHLKNFKDAVEVSQIIAA